MLSESSSDVNVSRIVLDLDRGLYHEDFNLSKLEALLADKKGVVGVELRLPAEKWFVLRALRPGVSARKRDYIARNRRELDGTAKAVKPARSTFLDFPRGHS